MPLRFDDGGVLLDLRGFVRVGFPRRICGRQKWIKRLVVGWVMVGWQRGSVGLEMGPLYVTLRQTKLCE